MLVEDVNFWARDKGFIVHSTADSWGQFPLLSVPLHGGKMDTMDAVHSGVHLR